MATKVGLVTYGMLGGGIERMLLNLGRYLSDKGMDITIVTTEVKGAWFEQIAKQGIRGVHIDGLEHRLPLQHALYVAEALKKESFDVVFLNHARFAQVVVDILPNGTSVIPIVHNMESLFHRLSTYKYPVLNAIVGVSNGITVNLEKHCQDFPVITIPNGIMELKVKDLPRRVFKEGHLNLIFVGRISKEKGALLLPGISAELSRRGIGFNLDIVGEGPLRHDVEYQISKMNLEGAVRFLGVMEQDRVYRLLAQAHLLLLPSDSEGFGLVLAEAQMFGCIPLAKRIDGVTDKIILNGLTGFLTEDCTAERFTDIIEGIAGNMTLLESMSHRAMNWANEQFSFRVCGEKYYDLILDAVEGRYPPQQCRGSSGLYTDRFLEEMTKILFLTEDPLTGELYRKWFDSFSKNGYGIARWLRNIGAKKVAIFGTLKTALYLMQDLQTEGIELITFLDNNKEMVGRNLAGIQVNSPSWLNDNSGLVDTVIISIESASDTLVKNQLALLMGDRKNRVVTWKELVLSLP